MPEQSTQSELSRQWTAFLNVILDPWVLVLGAVAAATGNAAIGATPPIAAVMLTLVASVSSGLLGGRVSQRWSAAVEENVIVARGKSAVRSLKLHLGSIADLEKRTRTFLARCDVSAPASKSSAPTAVAFEEIVGRCRLLEEQVLSSIENWTDIVPEADIRTQIGVISRLAEEVDAMAAESEALQKQLADTKDQSAAERARLQDELAKAERNLKETRRKLASEAATSGFTIGSTVHVGASPSVYTGLLSYMGKTCSNCGKTYSDDPGTVTIGNLCPACRNRTIVPRQVGGG